jgi:hypothetical protein
MTRAGCLMRNTWEQRPSTERETRQEMVGHVLGVVHRLVHRREKPGRDSFRDRSAVPPGLPRASDGGRAVRARYAA